MIRDKFIKKTCIHDIKLKFKLTERGLEILAANAESKVNNWQLQPSGLVPVNGRVDTIMASP